MKNRFLKHWDVSQFLIKRICFHKKTWVVHWKINLFSWKIMSLKKHHDFAMNLLYLWNSKAKSKASFAETKQILMRNIGPGGCPFHFSGFLVFASSLLGFFARSPGASGNRFWWFSMRIFCRLSNYVDRLASIIWRFLYSFFTGKC